LRKSGTTQGWFVGLFGVPHPAPPVNIPDGGPGGAGDAFLRLTSLGGAGPGSKLAVINLEQWAGNYTAAGVTGLAVDVRNFGPDEVALRLLLENPKGAVPTDRAITSPLILPPGSPWTSISFSLLPGDLKVLQGDVDVLLGEVTELRFFHGVADGFPGESLTAQLGIDNLRALGAQRVTEPGSLVLLSLGLAGGAMLRRRPGSALTPPA
jgi:hypothetical protein